MRPWRPTAISCGYGPSQLERDRQNDYCGDDLKLGRGSYPRYGLCELPTSLRKVLPRTYNQHLVGRSTVWNNRDRSKTPEKEIQPKTKEGTTTGISKPPDSGEPRILTTNRHSSNHRGDFRQAQREDPTLKNACQQALHPDGRSPLARGSVCDGPALFGLSVNTTCTVAAGSTPELDGATASPLGLPVSKGQPQPTCAQEEIEKEKRTDRLERERSGRSKSAEEQRRAADKVTKKKQGHVRRR
ncbi:hypothetical protein NDU88_001961 [Pleurodeles waltl]|uniref:Uncharacterized protein n=1 Tax=Pleurodeles waltl TaxID=8319 RepID=A0AAV7VBI1_PLEWA|nr:hypothetical protein NDU88_001961 [Pleurodeles waltl]